MSSTTFTRGDAINVYYPPEDPYYHGTYPAYFIKEYKGCNCSRVLWVGECEFKNSTTTVKNKYITLDAKRSRGEQFLFINNRFVKSPYLNHAIKSAMDSVITKEQHPAYFIFVYLSL